MIRFRVTSIKLGPSGFSGGGHMPLTDLMPCIVLTEVLVFEKADSTGLPLSLEVSSLMTWSIEAAALSLVGLEETVETELTDDAASFFASTALFFQVVACACDVAAEDGSLHDDAQPRA